MFNNFSKKHINNFIRKYVLYTKGENWLFIIWLLINIISHDLRTERPLNIRVNTRRIRVNKHFNQKERLLNFSKF